MSKRPLLFYLLLMLQVLTFTSYAQQKKSKSHSNVSKAGLALEGYDPVAYFNNAQAVEGNKNLSFALDGITYYFSSQQNRETFRNNPSRYLPEYGGWCAYAMGNSGEKVEVDPETFKIVNNKLYLFYNKYFSNTLKSWNKDEANLKRKADSNWKQFVK